MKWPTIKDVASELRAINANFEVGVQCSGCGFDHNADHDTYIDIRLQVYPDGAWAIRTGDSSYDTDHHGYWGVGSLPGVYRGRVRRFNSRDLARDLLEQCKDQAAMDIDNWPAWTKRCLKPVK
jgi:hypothetical protein